ncbi:MAG: hypothetical protein IPN86_15860 [Saprospiraceae bacterium]|nr:hypothetical protein [Saprospiraceae bacterium]
MNFNVRIIHRYLGFFLAGIMAVYAISGILMIFRETEFLKSEKVITKKFPSDIKIEDLGKAIKIRDIKIEEEKDNIVRFKQGTFDRNAGIVTYKAKQYPFILEKMTKLHKATNKQPLYYLNIFFGLSLLFFVISAFWMFMPSSDIFKKGLYFSIGGAILVLILLFI